MEPQFGEVAVRCGGCFVSCNELFPVGWLGVVFDVLNGGEVIIEDTVMLRGDVSCAWMQDEGDVAGVLRRMAETDTNTCAR